MVISLWVYRDDLKKNVSRYEKICNHRIREERSEDETKRIALCTY